MEDSDRLGSRQKEAEEGSPERLKAWGEASDSAAQPLERWGRRPGGQDRLKSPEAEREGGVRWRRANLVPVGDGPPPPHWSKTLLRIVNNRTQPGLVTRSTQALGEAEPERPWGSWRQREARWLYI